MKLINFLLIIVLLTATASLSAIPEDHLDEILAKMQNAARGIKTIHADMNLQKHDRNIGGKPEVYRGGIKFKHGARGKDMVRIDYTQPEGDVVAVDGEKIVIYQPRANQVIITSRKSQASQHQEFAFIETPYKSVPELKSQYNISHVGDEQVNGGWASVLELTPKAKSSVERIKLWVDHGSALPVKYEVRSGATVSTVTLAKLKTNEKMDDSDFEVKWKKGTQEIRP